MVSLEQSTGRRKQSSDMIHNKGSPRVAVGRSHGWRRRAPRETEKIMNRSSNRHPLHKTLKKSREELPVKLPQLGGNMSARREVREVRTTIQLGGFSLPPLVPMTLSRTHNQCVFVRGPTPFSNWVIPGVLMAGAYPAMLDDRQNDQNLKHFLKSGVNIDTFVCLQAEVDPNIPEKAWRACKGLRPYFRDVERLSKLPMKWIHLAITDGDITDDGIMETLIEELLSDICKGRVLYIHCWGGHGRTGVVACLILARLYNLSAEDALRRVQWYHDCRVEPQGAKSPQTLVQRRQVKRLMLKWTSAQNLLPQR